MKRTALLLVALFAACGQTHPASPPPPAHPEPAPSARAPEPAGNLAATTGFGCEHECNGDVSPGLAASLRERALQARACYDSALKKDPSLHGKVVVGLQLAEDGSVCASRLVKNTLQNKEAVACISQLFLGERFPAPEGGCVNIALPLNFVLSDAGAPQGGAPDAGRADAAP